MALRAAQVVAFFEEDAQMGLSTETREQLQVEGITAIDDLVDVDKDFIKRMAESL